MRKQQTGALTKNAITTRQIHQFFDPSGIKREVEIVVCPHCWCAFGVETVYLDLVDVHCPMCHEAVIIETVEMGEQ